jgi:8-oxo-dGTP pyrophosphatase MutT (NUDIX family)
VQEASKTNRKLRRRQRPDILRAMIHSPVESIAVLVFSPDRSSVLLILRRDVPVWVLPGGGIDPGESAEDSAMREILEETGLSVKIVRLIGEYFPINRLAKRTLLYECSHLSGSLQASSETKQVRFFPISNLPPMPPPYREWIEDGLAGKPPIQRKLRSVNYPTLVKYLMTHPILVARFLLARLGLAINS